MRVSLIKALMIASTVSTKDYCHKDKTCYPYHSDHFMYEGHGRVQLDRVLRFNESDFELFLYYGQVNKKKEEFLIRVPLKIFLHALHQWFFTAVVPGPQSGHGVHRLPSSVAE